MRVLLVDDDRILRTSLARVIATLPGVSVDEAPGVAAARELIEANAYDLVISDEQMPDGFGHALLAHLASTQPRCRRALMSGARPPVSGVIWDRFFAKPDAMQDLLTWVRAIPSES